MSKTNPPQASKKTDIAIIRSSAAEYLTFVAASGHGGVETVYADENVWITQKMMGLLYDIDVKTINYHLKKVFSDRELEACAVIRNFRITASDGEQYNTQHYNLAAIIAIGYKVNSDPLLKNGCAAKRTFWHKWRLWLSTQVLRRRPPWAVENGLTDSEKCRYNVATYSGS